MLQQYHWIIGWWQPRCERPLSFVEDDKLRPGEDVTSGSRRCRSFWKFRSKIRNVRHQTSTFKMADPAGTKTVEEAKKGKRRPKKDPTHHPGTRMSEMSSPRRRENQEFGHLTAKRQGFGRKVPSETIVPRRWGMMPEAGSRWSPPNCNCILYWGLSPPTLTVYSVFG